MAFFEDIFKGGNIVAGLAIGVGAAVLAPVVIPALRRLAKSVIKAGLIAYDQGRVALAELNEHTGDIMAEARAETIGGQRRRESRRSSTDADRREVSRGYKHPCHSDRCRGDRRDYCWGMGRCGVDSSESRHTGSSRDIMQS